MVEAPVEVAVAGDSVPVTGGDEERIRAVCEELAQRPAAAWVGLLRFVGFDGNAATFSPQPGSEHVLNLARGPMGQRLTDRLTEALGRRVAVRFVERAGALHAAGDEADAPVAGAAETPHDAARKLPLVRKVLEAFPDAMLIEARREEKK